MPRLAEQKKQFSTDHNLGFLFFGGSHERNKEAFNNAPDDKVTVFKDAGFNGTAKSYAPGDFVYLGVEGRDEISSVKIPQGLQLEVYHSGTPQQILNTPGNKHYQKSPAAVFTSSQAYIGDKHNDQIDTLRVSIYADPKEQQTGFDFEDDSNGSNPQPTNTQPDTTQPSTTQPGTTKPANPKPTNTQSGDNTLMYVLIGTGTVTAIGAAILLGTDVLD